MMPNQSIENIIEGLSLKFVLIDESNPIEINEIGEYFRKIINWADQTGADKIKEAVDQSLKIIQGIIDGKDPNTIESLDILGRTISAIQAIVINNRSDADVNFPAELQINLPCERKAPFQPEEVLSSPSAPKQKMEEETNQGSLTTTGLRHPGVLPNHFDDSLFAEFLALQNGILAEMEARTLEIERGTDKDRIGMLKRLFHTMKGEAGFLDLKDVSNLCHKTEDILEDANKADKHIDIFLGLIDWLKMAFDGYAGHGPMQETPVDLLEKLCKAKKALGDETCTLKDNHEQDSQAQVLENNIIPENMDINPSRESQGEIPPPANLKAKGDVKEIVNVDADRLDRLVEAIGELAIAESMVSQSQDLGDLASSELRRNLSRLDKITNQLYNMGLSLRMVSIKGTFHKMSRIVRDLAKKSGKEISFKMKGEDTELDKNLVDKIGEPLMHIVRNAVDHGIEADAKERSAAGKNSQGNMEIRAYHKGGFIFIEVEDDGRGIDREAVVNKAKELGLITKDTILGHQDAINLIFKQGFSTAQAVTDISGRGIGMDIVKTRINELRGNITITSIKEKGSIFCIQIPLTLAVIDGMVVSSDNELYIIPTLSVVTSLEFIQDKITNVLDQKQMIKVHNKLIPLIKLSRVFDSKSNGDNSKKQLIVVVEGNGQQVGIIVDEVLGKQQTVIKSLGQTMQEIPGITGGTIMPDGHISLILDIGRIISLANC